MKIVLPILVFGLLAGSAKAADSDDQLPPPSEGKTWKLVWHDEFDGDKLDDSKWDVPDHKRRDGWLHWDGYGKEHKSEGKVASVPGVMEGWHTFALLWKADEYVFYVDGKETWRTKAGGVCQVPLYIKLSDEIGDWGGDIIKAKLPDKFLVDYVRVYDAVQKQ